MSLNHVPAGHTATITEIHAREHLLHRMNALGLRRGRRIMVIRRARHEGPLHVRLGMTEVMLRRADAASVDVALNSD